MDSSFLRQEQSLTQDQSLTQEQIITKIFNENKVTDLRKFLNQRHCLNKFNVFLVYLFYVVQSSGILLTTIATSNDNKNLIYIGIGLNLIASIINVYEKVNNSLLKNMMANIVAIHNNNYIDEIALVDLENINAQQNVRSQSNQVPEQQTQLRDQQSEP